MSKLYKVNVQTFSNGFLLGVGTYDAERLGNSVDFIEQYDADQKALPLEKRDIPPMFEVIDTDKVVTTEEEREEAKLSEYSNMSKKDLTELCKQRGIEIKGKASQKELITLLVESDKSEMQNNDGIDNRFKSVDEFMLMKADEQIEYLDSVFVLPDGIEEGTDEEAEYIEALEVAVTAYGGMSVEKKVVAKIKDILDYINGDE